MAVQTFKDLHVFNIAFDLAMSIYEYSQAWPKEERYSMTDQIRRSSRSVCANISEAWRKRRYMRHFISELSDADAEAAETRVWLQFAQRCGYLYSSQYDSLDANYNRINGGLVNMMNQPEKWCGPSRL